MTVDAKAEDLGPPKQDSAGAVDFGHTEQSSENHPPALALKSEDDDHEFDLVTHFYGLLDNDRLSAEAQILLDYFCTLARLAFYGKAQFEPGFTGIQLLHQRLKNEAKWQCPTCFSFV